MRIKIVGIRMTRIRMVRIRAKMMVEMMVMGRYRLKSWSHFPLI